MNHTTNYSLPQWEATDAIKREDVNGALSALDTAMGDAAHIVIGEYHGDGASTRTFELGYQPRAVLLAYGSGAFSSGNSVYGGLMLPGYHGSTLELTETGFLVRANGNMRDAAYFYIIFR